MNSKYYFGNTQVEQLAQKYLEAKERENQSPTTLEAQTRKIQHFLDYIKERGISSIEELSTHLLERYQSYLSTAKSKIAKKPLVITTQSQRLMAACTFCRWLHENKYIQTDIASAIEYPKLPTQLPGVILTEKEVAKILSLPDPTTQNGLRDKIIMELLYATGMRSLELASVKISDIHLPRKLILIKDPKNKEERLVPLTARVMHWLEKYLSCLPQDSIYLISKQNGEPVHRTTISSTAKSYIKKAGIKKPGSSHIFRRSLATHLLDNGADIHVIKELLGHKKIECTQIYTKTSIKKLCQIHKQTHPAKLHPSKHKEIIQELEQAHKNNSSLPKE